MIETAVKDLVLEFHQITAYWYDFCCALATSWDCQSTRWLFGISTGINGIIYIQKVVHALDEPAFSGEPGKKHKGFKQ